MQDNEPRGMLDLEDSVPTVLRTTLCWYLQTDRLHVRI